MTGPDPNLGMVFQQDAIPMWLRVHENVSFGPRMRRVPQVEWMPRVQHFIEAVGLTGRERAWPKELSGGMRKRVAIAAVFANDPDILLMDEPFGSLDYFTRTNLHATLLDLWQETGKTIVFVTHDVDEALVLADRIIVVTDGRVGYDIDLDFARPRGDELRMNPEADAIRSAAAARAAGAREDAVVTAVATPRSRRLTLRTRASGLSILVGIVVLLAAWEVAAYVISSATPQGDRVMPSLGVVATTGLLGVSDYWGGGFGFTPTAQGGEQTYGAAVLALVSNAGLTLLRVVCGLSLALFVGIGLGLLTAAARPVRLAVTPVAEMLRMMPALAMAPLFTLWFGATTVAAVLFVVFGVAFIVLVGTVNAVRNLPPHTFEYARTLGVRGPQLWTRVALPAILPELRGTLVFGGLVSWTSVLAGEMYGLPSGLGWMLSETLRFSLVDRMVIVAVVFSVLALGTMKLLGALTGRLSRWA